MNIQELESSHFQIPEQAFCSSKLHTKISIQFALEMLKEFSLKESTIYSIEVYNKIEELEKYL